MALFRAPKEAVVPTTTRVGCEACELSVQWARLCHPKIGPEGADKPLVYFVGEAPGAEEDEQGRPFVGKSGQLLRDSLRRWALPYRIGNVARCRPPGNRAPSPSEIRACWTAYGLPDVQEKRPRVIVPLGATAMNRFLDGQISEWERVRVPVDVDGHATWVYPLYHPSYIQRLAGEGRFPETEVLWKQAMQMLNNEAHSWPEPTIVTHEQALEGITPIFPDQLHQMVELVISGNTLGVDLETTCLMPWEKDAKILSASLSNGTDTIAFLCEHPDNPYPDHALQLLFHALERARRLIAHNAAFEQRWLATYYGHQVFGWKWCDSMARPYAQYGVIQGQGSQSRDQDEGAGRLAGLGKQTQLEFGFNVKKVLNVDPVKWRNYTPEQLLLYNGLDAKWCHRVWHQPLPDWARPECERQRGATRLMAAISWQGMIVDVNELSRQTETLERSVKTELMQIRADGDVAQWEAQYRTPFNPASPDQVAKFFDIGSADEDALREVESPLAKKILRLRKLDKLLGTYAKGIHRVMYVDGRLHPDYTTMLTVTGRTSSRKPNSQNMPKRENKEFRKIIIPPPGYALVSFDFKQLEAGGCVMASKDPALMTYLWNGVDIHKEWAVAVLDEYPNIADRLCPHVTDDTKILARVRGEMKNTFTFPLIYGAGDKRCSDEMQVPLQYLGPVIERFWQKYAGIKRWQKTVHQFYDAHYYVETLTQRRRFAPVSWTEQLNTPIQGSGSDIVVDAGVRILDIAIEANDPHLIPMVNVHDDLSFYLPTNHLDRYIQIIAKEMVTPTFTWINIPLTVEVSVGMSNWSDQHELRSYQTGDFFSLPKDKLEHKVAALRRIAESQRKSGGIAARPITHPPSPVPTTRVSPNAARRQRVALAHVRSKH